MGNLSDHTVSLRKPRLKKELFCRHYLIFSRVWYMQNWHESYSIPTKEWDALMHRTIWEKGKLEY